MNDDIKRPIVRMAPSPTGNLHIGGVRTALFNYLFAKHHDGKYILRIEDTDKERSTKEFEKNILDSLEWAGIKHDELFRQSERTDIYVSHVKKMIDSGAAYISKEEPKEEGQRSEVVRFKNPNKKISFNDLIRGTVEFDSTELGDFVIAKSPEEPLYHLAVVVDDHEMGITHVIRGEEHLSNTPRQILIQEAIGANRPIYAHIPLILAPDRSKLSKRHGALSALEYRDQGFLPEAVVNYLALLGWNPGTEQEIFSLHELINSFDISHVQKGGAIFDIKKFRWVNKEHIRKLPLEEIKIEIKKKLKGKFPSEDLSDTLTAVILERIETFGDIDKMLEDGELDYYFNRPELQKEKIIWKGATEAETVDHLEKILELLPGVSDPRSPENIKEALMPYAEEAGKGNVLWPLRYSLSGKDRSPDPFSLIAILGKDESERRIENAVRMLS